MERSGLLCRGGKKRRGGWHHFLFRERQQFQRKQKRRDVMYVEEERQRGQRFNEEENAVLVSAVLDYYMELCGQSCIKGSATCKRQLWQEVTNRVNEVAPTYRTIEVCKKRYGDCRRAVKLKMVALEQQALGRGDPNEPIRFNHWEEKLRQKIASVIAGAAAGGEQLVLDTCEPASLETNDTNPAETSSSSHLCPSWTPTVDTAACAIPQPPSGEAYSEGEEATSPLDVQIVSEWSEEEPAGTPVTQVQPERMELPESLQEAKVSPAEDGGQYVTIPEAAFLEPHYQQIQEEQRKNLRHLTRAHSAELHKLRENMVEGNARVVQQLESLASEVRELNTHIRQIHMNQAHFNLMFQNYLSDTKQFYGAMVQAVRNLQQAPSISPAPSPGSSPATSPKPHPVPTQSTPLLQTPMTDFSTLSPAGSAEPASASSTGSEVPVYSTKRYKRRPNSTFHPQLPNNQ